MKKQITKDTLIQISDMIEKPSIDKVIECNVNMNVSLSNTKRSRISQRTHSLLTILLVITFFIAYSQLRKEVQILEAQMNSINSNLVTLLLRNERLHRNLNRSNRDHQSMTQFHLYNNKEDIMSYNKFPSNTKINNDNTFLTTSNGNDKEGEDNNNYRVVRSIVTFEGQNETEKMTVVDDMNDVKNEHSILWNDSRTGRLRRDDGRGKQRRKSKRRLKRSRRRLGPLVATFVGGIPEQNVTNTGYIGPWVKKNESRYGFNKFHLVEDKHSIEVTASGLFMISTQIYYFGEPNHYSYWILLSSEGSSITRKIIKCATVSAASATEASCYTSVILPLRRGDRLHIQQQERDRLINLREGHSYVQIILLSNDQPKKRIATTT